MSRVPFPAAMMAIATWTDGASGLALPPFNLSRDRVVDILLLNTNAWTAVEGTFASHFGRGYSQAKIAGKFMNQ